MANELDGLRGYQLPAPSAVIYELPKYTTTEKNALVLGTKIGIIFDSTLNKICLWNGSAWVTQG